MIGKGVNISDGYQLAVNKFSNFWPRPADGSKRRDGIIGDINAHPEKSGSISRVDREVVTKAFDLLYLFRMRRPRCPRKIR